MGKKHKKHHRSEQQVEELNRDLVPAKDPIRLVLKVGAASGYSPASSPPSAAADNVDDDRKHKHHKKSKKKKKKRERGSREGSMVAGAGLGATRHVGGHTTAAPAHAASEELRASSAERPSRQLPIGELLSDGPPRKRAALSTAQDTPERRSLREPRQCTLGGREEIIVINALNETLNYIHRLMQKRDNNGFFSFPVNDTIAPGYSTIIKQPMDLSTMKSKVDNGIYRNIMEYKADLKLICVNAMTYNHPETVYYKAAQKLLEYGMRTLSKEKLASWRRSMPFMTTIADHELALDQDVDASDYVAPVRVQKKEKIKNYLHFEPIPDNLPAKDILALAQEASRTAAEELAARRPHSKMGFLRQRDDGTTTLNFLNPDADGCVSEKERVITFGQMAGKLQAGTWNIPGFKEDERNKANPVTYLNYGPFASHAPTHDSAFANLTKEESSLLLSTYGGEMPMAYARSVMDFVSGAEEHTLKMAESLLDSLTAHKHTTAMKALTEYREQHQKDADATTAGKDGALSSEADVQASKGTLDASGNEESSSGNVNFDALRGLAKIGIDVSFLDYFEKQKTVQGQLGRTSVCLQELEGLQSERLSRPLVPSTNRPTEAELKLAYDVTRELTLLTKQVAPGDVVSSDAVHNALGIVPHGGGGGAASSVMAAVNEETTSNAAHTSRVHLSLLSDDDGGAVAGDDGGLQRLLETVPLL